MPEDTGAGAGRKILEANDAFALENSIFLSGKNLPCLNLISSPGSGKTTILEKTIQGLSSRIRIGVIEGDIATSIDADRIRAAGADVVLINTDGACHLSARQVGRALKDLPVDRLDILFIENVGNLVCPSAFALGESAKVAVLSVAEGDDKPAKYPALFARAKAMLVNKIDLLGHGADFDMARIEKDVRTLNRSIEIFQVSARTGEGMDLWYQWLEKCLVGHV